MPWWWPLSLTIKRRCGRSARPIPLTWPWQVPLIAAPLLAVLAGAARHPARPGSANALGRAGDHHAVAGSTTLAPAYIAGAAAGAPGRRLWRCNRLSCSARITRRRRPTTRIAGGHLAGAPIPCPLTTTSFQALAGKRRRCGGRRDRRSRWRARLATSCQPGEILRDTYELDLSNEPAGEPLTYYFGYYDWRATAHVCPSTAADDKLVPMASNVQAALQSLRRTRCGRRAYLARGAYGLLWLTLALTALAVAFLLPGYFWGANDARHHVYFLFEYDRLVQDGIWWPRWSPDFAFGYGYPFFNIYGLSATSGRTVAPFPRLQLHGRSGDSA